MPETKTAKTAKNAPATGKASVRPASVTGNLPDFHKIFDVLPARYVGFHTDDPDFTVAFENRAHAEVAMVKQEETIGKPLFAVWPDTSEKYKKTGVSDLIESLRKVIKTGKPDTMPLLHYDLPDPDGRLVTKFWRVTHYPLFDKGGNVEYVFQATEDITGEITAGNKLERLQNQLDEALSVGRVGTWAWDVLDNVVIGDKNMADMFGLDAKTAAEGLPLSAFTAAMHPDDRGRVRKEIAAVLKGGDIFHSEYRTVSPDGVIRWVVARGRIERDSRGKAAAIPGILVDITERKLVENNLSYLAKASTILSASLDYPKTLQTTASLIVPDIADWCTVDILDSKGQLELVAIAHKDPAKVKCARDLRKAQGPPDLTVETGVAKVMRTGRPEFYPVIDDAMLVASAKNAQELKLLRELALSSVIIVPLKIDDKPMGALTLIGTDHKRYFSNSDLEMAEELASRASLAISNARLYADAQRELAERKRLQEELRIANEQLEERVEQRTAELELTNLNLHRSNQELQDFAYVASHDLQEPLRKIQAFGNLLETEYANKLGEGQDYLERMRNAAKRMSDLIEDILSFSRVTTRARGFTTVNLRTVVDEVLDDLEVRVADTGATVEIGDLPTIHADAMQMRQLLQNLIGNALKFHRENVPPVIKIRATRTTLPGDKIKYCQLEVEDNGLGFDEKYLDRIFAVFQRLHDRQSYEGTGIGLAVCRKIVERHGGMITAKSKPGKGSTFIILLPMRHKKGDSL